MEVAFFALVVYVVLETLFLVYAAFRGVRFGRFRGTCYGLAIVVTLVIALLLYARTGSVVS